MNRDQWKAFSHSIRADARDFKTRVGGFPCFARNFTHNGQEWTLTRQLNDRRSWNTRLAASSIRARPRSARHADEIDSAKDHRRAIKRAPWTAEIHKRGIRAAIKSARQIRQEKS